MTPEILLVEDDAGHARLFQNALHRGGIDARVHWVQDGQAALDFVCRKGAYETQPQPAPFVVTLDLNLPGLDGFQVLARLRSDPAIGHLPIMVLTTSDHPHDLRRSLDLGCDDFLSKAPALSDPAMLATRIRYLFSLLGGHKGRQERSALPACDEDGGAAVPCPRDG